MASVHIHAAHVHLVFDE